MVSSAVHVTKNRCRSPLRVGSTCNVGKKLATYAHVAIVGKVAFIAITITGFLFIEYKSHNEVFLAACGFDELS